MGVKEVGRKTKRIATKNVEKGVMVHVFFLMREYKNFGLAAIL